jgi:hypothetical protein
MLEDVLDTQAQTRARFEKGPFSTSPIGRELLKRVIPTLADNIRAAIEVGSDTAPPRGLEQVLRLKTPEELAFMAFRTLVNQRGLGPDRDAKKRKKKRKNPPKNPEMALRLDLGRLLRDELRRGTRRSRLQRNGRNSASPSGRTRNAHRPETG